MIWDVCTLANGDLVCGCSDSSVRIWTRDSKLALSADLQAAFEESVKTKKEGQSSGGGGGTPAGVKLEHISALLQPGDRDGAYKFIDEQGAGWAYQWSSAQGEWIKIGQLTEGPGDSGSGGASNEINGVRYDRVVPVEMDDGVSRKIGWNTGENPYEVAARWLADNNMPEYFREQIVQFVIQNSPESQGGFFSRADADAQNNADPLSGNRSTQHQANQYIPQSTYVKVELVPQIEGLRKKLAEFNGELSTLQVFQYDIE